MSYVSKLFIVLGVLFICFGLLWHFTDGKIPIGRLPGDIRIVKENSSFYFPITTCLVISGLLSLISFILKK